MHCKLNFEIDGVDYFIEKAKGKKILEVDNVKLILIFG